MTKTITLTDAQYKKLADILSAYTDEGPSDEGWASRELEELRNAVSVHEPPELIWRIGGRVVSEEEGKAAMRAALEPRAEPVCNGNCFQVGGPFVTVDPACPLHGEHYK